MEFAREPRINRFDNGSPLPAAGSSTGGGSSTPCRNKTSFWGYEIAFKDTRGRREGDEKGDEKGDENEDEKWRPGVHRQLDLPSEEGTP